MTKQDAKAGVLRSALGSYGLSNLKARPLRSTNNTVFALTSVDNEPQYVLRVHRPRYRDPANVRSELYFLEGLNANTGLRVPSPLRNRDGEFVTALSTGEARESLLVDVLKWVPGSVRRAGAGLGPGGCYRLGKTLALIHAYGDSFQPPADFCLPLWDADAMFTKSSPYRPGDFKALLSPEQSGVFFDAEERARAAFQEFQVNKGSQGLIHGDFILGNCLFLKGEVAVLDFDDCGHGFYLYDICTLLDNLRGVAGYSARRSAMLSGYRSVKPLGAEVEEHFGALMAARHASCILWAASLLRTNRWSEKQTKTHVEYRIDEIRRCLSTNAW